MAISRLATCCKHLSQDTIPTCAKQIYNICRTCCIAVRIFLYHCTRRCRCIRIITLNVPGGNWTHDTEILSLIFYQLNYRSTFTRHSLKSSKLCKIGWDCCMCLSGYNTVATQEFQTRYLIWAKHLRKVFRLRRTGSRRFFRIQGFEPCKLFGYKPTVSLWNKCIVWLLSASL